jgi:ABC-type Mn2+/Zn2+ transport system permease subunit
MFAVRRIVFHILITCAIILMMVAHGVLMSLALWVLPNREAQEIRNALKRNGY